MGFLLSNVPHNERSETYCPICGGQRRKHLRCEREFPVWKCLSCKHLYVSPRPSKSWLKQYYSEDWKAEDENRKKEIFDFVIRAANSYLPQRGDVLDVGMGTGMFLKHAAARGWRIHGIEADDRAYETAVNNLGEAHNLHRGMFETVDLTPESLDCVVMINVIEHIIDPQEIFAKAYKTIRPGGCLAVRYPDCSKFLAAPAHLHNFSRASARKLFLLTGFRDVRFFYAGIRDCDVNDSFKKRVGVQVARRIYKPLMHCTSGTLSIPYVSQLVVGRKPRASNDRRRTVANAKLGIDLLSAGVPRR